MIPWCWMRSVLIFPLLFILASVGFLACGKDMDRELLDAAMSGKAELVRHCLENGADVNAKDQKHQSTALMWAAHNGHVEALKILIAHGANIEQKRFKGETALWFAAQKGQLETLKILADKGADINTIGRDGDSALAVALKNGHLHVAEYLKNAGASD